MGWGFSTGKNGPFTTDFGRDKGEQGISVIVPKEGAKSLIIRLRENLQPGLIAFKCRISGSKRIYY